MELSDLRLQIDAIDRDLVRLFDARMRVSADIAAFKMKNELPVLDTAREQAKLNAVAESVSPELQDYVRRLYVSIFDLSRDYQEKLKRELNEPGDSASKPMP